MPNWLSIILVLVAAGLIIGSVVQYIRYKKNIERSFNMVFLDIKVPKKESKEDKEVEGEQYSTQKDFKEIAGGVMTQFFESLHSLYIKEWYKIFKGQNFLSFEMAVIDGLIHFFVVCPRDLLSLVEKQLTGFYPDAYVEQVEDYNIFQPNCHVVSCYMAPKKEYFYPIRTYARMNADPLNAIINSMSKIGKDEGAAVQVMIRPKKHGWQEKGRKEAS